MSANYTDRSQESYIPPEKYIGQLEKEVERLTVLLNSAEERSKACDHIAEGEEGWQVLRNLCMSTMSISALRDRHDRLRAALEKVDTGCDMAPYTSCSAQGPKFRCRSCIAREALAAKA